jgi:GTP cyclohydrolase-4
VELIQRDLPDVQRDAPLIPIAINNVCVEGLKVKLCLKNRSGYLECSIASVTACVDLGKEFRGVHVSRSVEDILNIANGTIYDDLPDLQRILRDVAGGLITKHEYSSKAIVKLKMQHLYTSEDIDAVPINMRVVVELGKDGRVRYGVGVGVIGMSVCPCAQQVYAFMESLTAPNAPSHSQRALLYVHIDSPTIIDLKLSEAMNVLFSAFSAPIKSFLKREQEYKLVKRAFENPRFAEDIAREAVYMVYKVFRNRLSEDSNITAKVVSFESVHPFNLYVRMKYSIGELDKIFSKGVIK